MPQRLEETFWLRSNLPLNGMWNMPLTATSREILECWLWAAERERRRAAEKQAMGNWLGGDGNEQKFWKTIGNWAGTATSRNPRI